MEFRRVLFRSRWARLVHGGHRHGLSGKNLAAGVSRRTENLRLGRRGSGRLSAVAEYSGCERAGQRLLMGKSSRARQELLPFWRVYLDDLLRRGEDRKPAAGAHA